MPARMRASGARPVAGKAHDVAGGIRSHVLHLFLQGIEIDVAKNGQLLEAGKELGAALGQLFDEFAKVAKGRAQGATRRKR